MDSIYQALFSSSHIVIEQLGQMIAPEQNGFGPFWVFLDVHRNIRAGSKKRLDETLDEPQQLDTLCTSVDDGFEPAIMMAGESVVAAGQLCTERNNCGYMILVLPGYCMETAEANTDLIEMMMNHMNLLAGCIEKNNMYYQEQLCRKSHQSPLLSRKS